MNKTPEWNPIEDLKTRCNRYVNGYCGTLSCLKRGGYHELHGPYLDKDELYQKATCAEHEVIKMLDGGEVWLKKEQIDLQPIRCLCELNVKLQPIKECQFHYDMRLENEALKIKVAELEKQSVEDCAKRICEFCRDHIPAKRGDGPFSPFVWYHKKDGAFFRCKADDIRTVIDLSKIKDEN